MKRCIVPSMLVLIATSVAGLAGPAAAAPEPRREEHIYNGARGGSGPQETNLQDLVFTSHEGEHFIQVVVTDRNEGPVGVTVSQDDDQDGVPDSTYEVCGTTGWPLRIVGGPDIHVHVETAACEGAVGATTGVVEMFFFTTKRQALRWDQNPEAPAPPINGTRRTAEGTYQGTVGVGATDTNVHFLLLEPVGGASFMSRSTESHLEVVVTDDSGLPTRAQIFQSTDGGPGEALATICGKTTKPIAIEPGMDIAVAVMNGPCPDASPAIATQGTITATFLSP